jgi:hypothetical protein
MFQGNHLAKRFLVKGTELGYVSRSCIPYREEQTQVNLPSFFDSLANLGYYRKFQSEFQGEFSGVLVLQDSTFPVLLLGVKFVLQE